jgi:hypothetical protein
VLFGWSWVVSCDFKFMLGREIIGDGGWDRAEEVKVAGVMDSQEMER